MNVRIDSNGYYYNADTGDYLSLYFDDAGNAFDSRTDEPVTSITSDDGANQTVYRTGVDWNQFAQTAAQGVFGQPRSQYSGQNNNTVRTNLAANQNGISANVAVPKWAVYLGGAAAFGFIASYVFPTKGRR